jgi:sigma-B regulation protein RsbQ
MTTNSININGENLSYIDSKNGDITLLFLHGAFINKEYWNDQIYHFSKKYRVAAIDLAGHGNSTHNRSELSCKNFGKDISEFIQALSLENVIIIGHSFGSDVMLETVNFDSSKIKGLVEVDHMKNVGVELPAETINFLVQSLKTDFTATCEQIAKQALITDKTNLQLVDRLLKDYRKMNPVIGTQLLESGFHYPSRETELLKGLKLKLFLIHVNYSDTNEENLRECLGNNYELFSISGTCHYPMVENPEDFNKALELIISKIESE